MQVRDGFIALLTFTAWILPWKVISMSEHGDDFPDQKPLLILIIFNKNEKYDKRHSV